MPIISLISSQPPVVGRMAERVKKPFYGDRVISMAWSRFNSYPRRTRCCVLG